MTSRFHVGNKTLPCKVTRRLEQPFTNAYEEIFAIVSSDAAGIVPPATTRKSTNAEGPQHAVGTPSSPHSNMSDYILGRIPRPHPWSDCRGLHQIPSLSDNERSTMKVSNWLNTPRRRSLPDLQSTLPNLVQECLNPQVTMSHQDAEDVEFFTSRVCFYTVDSSRWAHARHRPLRKCLFWIGTTKRGPLSCTSANLCMCGNVHRTRRMIRQRTTVLRFLVHRVGTPTGTFARFRDYRRKSARL